MTPLAPAPPAVELRGVSRRFGAAPAVDDVDLVVPDGELLALVGPSGCGKSTLLLLVAGLLQPDAGEVRVGGRTVTGPGTWVPPEQRRVGVVFQDAALFPHLRVSDNLAFGLPRGADRRRRVEELLELVELPGLAARYPHELSGGQQQRVAVCVALVNDPPLVLGDEPTGNLDSENNRITCDLLVSLDAQGRTVIIATHDPGVAERFPRVISMQDGRIVSDVKKQA